MKSIVLLREDMPKYFRQTMEYVFLDKVSIVPGEKAEGEKHITEDEWYFQYHFPGNPIMPGVFQMEAIMQTGGLIINTLPEKEQIKLYFSESKSTKIYGSVVPGDILKTYVEMKSFRRGIAWFDGKVEVNDKITCKMQFSLIAPDELVKMTRQE